MRYSKQRESIMEAVRSHDGHPTADQVYKTVRQNNPNISLGTVYRNLNQLAESGVLVRIPVSGSRDRFDHNTHAHFHAQCTSCGSFFDVPCDICEELTDLLERIEARTGMTVAAERVQFQKICSGCQTRQENVTVRDHKEKRRIT
ncbi:MAG TPA: transcriptional repressor [Clostridiales bacterium]|nr:transcriptional repressor [Clostridiales bacterium]